MQKMLLLSLTIPWLLALGACEPKRVQLAIPPVSLTVCADEPVAPDLPPHDWTSIAAAKARVGQRDAKVLDYALAMREAWGDCKADVVGLAAWRATAAD